MRQVWKYNFGSLGQHDITLPRGASVLHFAIQDGMFTIWALVDPRQEKQDIRRFEIIGTGHDTYRRSYEYMGTIQDGSFVWHMFEVTVENDRVGWDDE